MREVRLANYRCFREPQTARLAPLTFLVGENSTGKTSFLALIRALWDIAYRNRIPNFKEEPYDLGSFDEIAHYRGGRGGRADEFRAGFFLSSGSGGDAGHNFDATFARKDSAPFPVRRRYSNLSGDIWIECCSPMEGEDTIRASAAGREWESSTAKIRIAFSPDDETLLPLQVFWSILASNGSTKLPRNFREKIDSVLFGGSFSMSELYASAPVRSKPHRTYDPIRVTRDAEGDYVPMYLAKEHFRNKAAWNGLKRELEVFGKEAGLFNEISVKPLGKEGGPFQIQIRRFGHGAKGPLRNLIDVGYGVSQVLPVITEILREDAPPTMLLQQPEVHLHPSAQAALGTLLCRVAGPSRQFVIETHSDHLLDRVRTDVRDGESKLKPADVSILYFERNGIDVLIHSLKLDEQGNILDAPNGYRRFFMEETTRSIWKKGTGPRAA